jgi:hypothetical protein
MTAMRRSVLALTIACATTAALAQTAQKTFPSPEAAADALIEAAAKYDVEALKAIVGPDGIDLVVTEDAVQSKQLALAFAELAKQKHHIQREGSSKAILVIGPDDWPGPIPIVLSGKSWKFDSKAGRQEVLFRRIGNNELDAIQVCRGYVEAQEDYASTKHDGISVNQYAQKIIASPGKQDGLAWKKADGTWDGPVGENIARVIAEGYSDKSQPYHGYYFKVLKRQGPAARFGEIDFVVKNVMIGGFALVAAPADYRVTGVKTFIVNQDGVVYEKDLGTGTLDAFKAMTTFNPDKTWKATAD